jgi:hypothetical protein
MTTLDAPPGRRRRRRILAPLLAATVLIAGNVVLLTATRSRAAIAIDWGAPKNATQLEWLALSMDVATLNECVRYKRCLGAVTGFGQCTHAEKHLLVSVDKGEKGYEREIKRAAQLVMGTSGGIFISRMPDIEFLLTDLRRPAASEVIRCRLSKASLGLMTKDPATFELHDICSYLQRMAVDENTRIDEYFPPQR